MNKEIKKKWIKALRSGEYLQGHHVLRDNNNKFCCLGVLCDLIDKKHWLSTVDIHMNDTVYSYGGKYKMPPSYILEKCGITCGQCQELINQNDNFVTFSEIADYIEKIM